MRRMMGLLVMGTSSVVLSAGLKQASADALPQVGGIRATPIAEVRSARGLAFDPASGYLYSVDELGGALYRIGTDGARTLVRDLPAGMIGPTVDPGSGDVYVSHFYGGRVLRIDEGGLIAEIATGIDGPTHLAIWDGDVYVGDFYEDRILSIAPSGEVTTFVSGVPRPDGMTIGPDGYLYIAARGTHEIMRVSMSGGTPEVFATGMRNPYAVAFDVEHNLFVANGADGTISMVDGTGAVTTVGDGFKNPNGIAFDGAGCMYVADFEAGAVYRIPEPASILLLALGAALLLARRR